MQVLIVLDITCPTSGVYVWREGLEMQLVHVVLVVLRRDQDRVERGLVNNAVDGCKPQSSGE